MAWQAIPVSATQVENHWLVSWVFTDGKQKIFRGYQSAALSLAGMKAFAMGVVGELDTVANSASEAPKIAFGQPFDLTPDLPTPPDPAAVARGAYFSLVARCQSAIQQRSVGAPIDQTLIDDLQAQIAKAFLSEYVNS